MSETPDIPGAAADVTRALDGLWDGLVSEREIIADLESGLRKLGSEYQYPATKRSIMDTRIISTLGWVGRVLLAVFTIMALLDPKPYALAVVAVALMVDAHILRWIHREQT